MAQYTHLNIEKKIANLFGTSDVTICKIFNKISPYIDALVNDEATEYLINKFKINGFYNLILILQTYTIYNYYHINNYINY